jgi:hypothetical protein
MASQNQVNRDRAERAKQMLESDLFAEMLTEVRVDALNALATVKVDDTLSILGLQAIVAVTGEIKDRLEAVVLRAGQSDGGMSLSPTKDDTDE